MRLASKIYLILLFPISILAQTPKIEQLRAELKEYTGQDTFRVNRLNDLGFELRNKLPTEAYTVFNEALQLARNIKYESGEANSLMSLGFHYRFKGEFGQSIKVTEEALAKYRILKDTLKIITCDYNLAYTNINLGEIKQAINHGLSALHMADFINDSKWKILSNTQMGNLYNGLKDYTRAKHHLNLAYNLAEAAHDEDGMDHCMLALSFIATYEKQYEKAIQYIDRGLTYAKKTQSTQNLLMYGLSRQDINLEMKNYDAVFKAMPAIIELRDQKDFVGYRPWSDRILATAYFYTGKIDSAIYYGLRCKMAGLDRGIKNSTNRINDLLAQAYEKKGLYKEAFKAQRAYNNYTDSLNLVESIRAVSATQYASDIDKKQAEIDLLAKNEQLVRDKNKQQQKLLWGTGGGLLLLSSLLFFLYRNNLQKIKANQQLKKQQDDLKATQAQLIQAEKMASLGELTAGIAHEIQNPLNFVNNFSEVSAELIDEMNEELNQGNLPVARDIAKDLKQNLEKINHHGKRAESIVKGMLQHSRNTGGIKELTDINALCDEYLRLAYHACLRQGSGRQGYKTKDKTFNVDFETQYDPSLPNINVVTQDIGRAILNIVNNAFYALSSTDLTDKAALSATDSTDKAALSATESPEFKPKLKLTTTLIDKSQARSIKSSGLQPPFVQINISDNGPGIPQGLIDKIFQPFFTTKPTGQGTGLGLSLAYDIIQAHGGNIQVLSNKNSGTEFIIQLPGK